MSEDRPKKSLKEIAEASKRRTELEGPSSRDSMPPVSRPPGSIPSPPVSRPPGSIPSPPVSQPPGSVRGPAPAVSSGAVDLSTIAARISAPPPAPPSKPPASVAGKEDEKSAPIPPTKPSGGPATATPAAEEKKGGGAMWIVAGLAAAAALGVVVLKNRAPDPAPTAPVATASAKPEAATSAAAPTTAPAVSKDPSTVDINALGQNPSAAPTASLRPYGAAGAKGDKDDKPAASVADPVPVASAAPPVPTGSVGALRDEMKKSVGAKDDAPGEKSDAKEGPAANQQKPSAGAVQGAIGAVRGAAKACVEDIEGVTRVSVVFQSDGSVQSVSVSGVAGGKSAEGCIKAAVMKAKVAPFTDATYSASFTLRSSG